MTHIYLETGAILIPNMYRAITIEIDYTNLYSGNRHQLIEYPVGSDNTSF